MQHIAMNFATITNSPVGRASEAPTSTCLLHHVPSFYLFVDGRLLHVEKPYLRVNFFSRHFWYRAPQN